MAPTADPQALLLVDLQQAFLSGPTAVPASRVLLAAARAQLAAARAAGALVVHVQDDGTAGSPGERGTPGFDLVLAVEANDVVLTKTRDDAFDGTDLDDALRRSHVDAVSVCGVQSEMCVAATARSALARGYGVVLAQDAHATYPVPALEPGGVEVPAALAARVAEWSLGDEVVVVATSAEVRFARP